LKASHNSLPRLLNKSVCEHSQLHSVWNHPPQGSVKLRENARNRHWFSIKHSA